MEHNKTSVIEAIKKNTHFLNVIILLIVIILLVLNIRFLYSIIDYIPSYSIVALLTITSSLVIISLCVSRIISRSAIREFEEYDKKLNNALHALEQEMKERERIKNQLENTSSHDQLTNLPNRELLIRRLRRLITRRDRHENYMFAVVFLDLDRFKVINDSLGHSVGDQMLIAYSQRLESFIRTADTIARFGGDEFVLILDDIKNANDSIRVANRIQEVFSVPLNLDGHEIFTTVSIGIALSVTGYDLPEDMLRDAESAMYRAKTSGRGRYEIFSNDIHRSSMKLLQLESDLWRAVENMEFDVHYQPIVSLTDGSIAGSEALLRWNHPEHGFIPPSEFIPLTEEIGLISTIGEWILRTACAQNRKWQEDGYHDLKVDVNFSSRQFQFQNIPNMVQNVLLETGLAAHSLNVEITETIAMESHSINILNELSAMGVKTSVDDFGTGYSSLGCLKKFPIDLIKIDKTFIKDITINANVEAIIQAIIAMAHTLKIKVIAEGVETGEQLAFLMSSACDEVQGYLISPPVPSEEFTELLKKGKYPVAQYSGNPSRVS